MAHLGGERKDRVAHEDVFFLMLRIPLCTWMENICI